MDKIYPNHCNEHGSSGFAEFSPKGGGVNAELFGSRGAIPPVPLEGGLDQGAFVTAQVLARWCLSWRAALGHVFKGGRQL